ncbi:hypothetical protein, partial [Sphingomonas sp. GC_Shp_4]|uniref:hypothetical protein n=1 Tax=Sphingomonas sp. GC_Shp_4 TaxID=2937382 RepID=UPI00226B0B0B
VVGGVGCEQAAVDKRHSLLLQPDRRSRRQVSGTSLERVNVSTSRAARWHIVTITESRTPVAALPQVGDDG